MPLAYERVIAPGPGYPITERPAQQSEPCLNITVVFTSVEATLAALREAGTLADRLSGRVTLVVTQIVPYPLPLTSPPVLITWNERRFRLLAAKSPVETRVAVYLCRDRDRTIVEHLSPRSVVVLAGRKRWWPTDESRLARTLRKAGHEVIFKRME
jgi:hypothetical protein